MSTFRLLRENLVSTVVTAVVCAFLGYLISFPVGLVSHREAMAFRYGSKSAVGRSIETEKLRAFSRMQTALVGFGAFVGVVAAQSVFIVRHLPGKTEVDRQH